MDRQDDIIAIVHLIVLSEYQIDMEQYFIGMLIVYPRHLF